jgi:hypothetical protein
MENEPFLEVLEALSKLFTEHAPETLMALFGAATSILLFYFIWYLLRQLLNQVNETATQDAGQDQTTAALVETLIGELLTEAEHLRNNLQEVLQASLKQGEENNQTLSALMVKTDGVPTQLVELLKPEFAHLQQEMRLTEERIVTKITEGVRIENENN